MKKILKFKKRANAVFEGGGVKGIGIAGALTVASRYFDWVYVAGTSAGAVVASLIAAGYTAEEIKDLVFNIDYRQFEDTDVLGQIPLIGPFWHLKFKLGLFKGDYIEEWVREALKEKGVEQFGDLVVHRNARNPKGRYRLRVVASDISTGTMLVLPQDIARYGIDPDYLEVAKAIRMSISIPFFFRPVKLVYKDEDNRHRISYIVDGGVLSNFPVWLFDKGTGTEGLPTIGFKLVGPDTGRENDIHGPFSMLKALFSTMIEAHDNRFIEEKAFARTIPIPTQGVRSTDFHISRDKIEELFQAGVGAAEDFFKNRSYRGYMLKYLNG